MTHKEACYDLATEKGTPFVEVNLGSPYLAHYAGATFPGIADVIKIRPSYNRFNLDIYEVKVSRSDLLQDIASEKYKKYLTHCHRFYYACIDSIYEDVTLPEGVGLIVKKETGWHTIKAAKPRELNIDQHVLLSMLFYKQRQDPNVRRRLELASLKPYELRDLYIPVETKHKLKHLGKVIASALKHFYHCSLAAKARNRVE